MIQIDKADQYRDFEVLDGYQIQHKGDKVVVAIVEEISESIDYSRSPEGDRVQNRYIKYIIAKPIHDVTNALQSKISRLEWRIRERDKEKEEVEKQNKELLAKIEDLKVKLREAGGYIDGNPDWYKGARHIMLDDD